MRDFKSGIGNPYTKADPVAFEFGSGYLYGIGYGAGNGWGYGHACGHSKGNGYGAGSFSLEARGYPHILIQYWS